MAESLTCTWCHEEFWVKPYRQATARFCSISCASRWQKANRPWSNGGRRHATCRTCGISFFCWRHEVSTRKFCTWRCRRAYYQVPANIRNMDRLRELAYDRDGGRCVDCGGRRYVETHHVNGNSKDHRLDNLVTVCKKHHVARHLALTGRLPSGHLPKHEVRT